MAQVKRVVVLVLLLIIMLLGLSFLRPMGNVTFEITSYPSDNTSICQQLNTSGSYILNTDVLNENVSSSGCFNIIVSDVELDCAGHVIRNMTIAQAGVYAENVKNISIKNCNIEMSDSLGGYGIYFSGVNDSSILNCNLSSNNIGVYIKSGYSNQIISNIINENSNKGLLIESGSGNTIQSNTLNSNKLAVYILKSSSNILNSNHIWNCTPSDSEGCLSFIGSSSNFVTLGEINVSSGDLVFLYDSAGFSSSNNLFKNLILSGATGYQVNVVKVSDASVNNSFVNVSYLSSKEFVSSGNELIRKWYYRVLVNTSRGGLVSNANVTIYNSSNGFVAYALTDSSGLISSQELISYLNNGAQINRSYWVIASNASSSANHTFNLLDNNLNDFLTFNITTASAANTTNTTNTTTTTTNTNTTTTTNTNTTTTTTTQTTETNRNSGGSRISYYNITDLQLEGGYEQEMDEGDTIFINSTAENHTVILEKFVRNVSNYSVTIVVYSDPINISLGLGEQRKIDTDVDGYYDLLIGFKNITENDRPHILIARINETIAKTSGDLAASSEQKNENNNNFLSMLLKKANVLVFWKISILHILIIAIIAGIIIFYVYRARKNSRGFSRIFSSKHKHSPKKRHR